MSVDVADPPPLWLVLARLGFEPGYVKHVMDLDREDEPVSTGMPAGIWLNKFGVIVHDYFGHVPYHVGSSLTTKQWRDVDVRLILPDDEFTERFGCIQSAEVNPKLAAITLAFSALGKAMTGLPIDFQIQPQTHANEKYPGMRSALIEIRD